MAEEDATSVQGRHGVRAYRAELRLLPGGRYEATVERPDALHAPVCSLDLLLEERGTARFGLTQGDGGRLAKGTLVLQPEASRLTETVVNCGAAGGRRTVALDPGPRWFPSVTLRMANGVTGAHRPDDALRLGCPYEPRQEGPYQYLLCEELGGLLFGGYRRR